MCKRLICSLFVIVLGMIENAGADLVAHWKLDGVSGTTAYDTSGNGYDGTLNGDATWADGQLGGALQLDGSGDYVNCGTGVSFTTVGDGGTAEGYTISVWIYPSNPGGDGKICGDLDDPGWGAAGGFKLALYQTRIESDVRDSSGRFFSRDATGPQGLALEADTWYHVAVVYDDADDTYTEYINGEVSRSMSVTQGVAASTADFRIGADTPNLGHYYNGLLDDLRIYDSALSEQEILGVMQGGGVSYPFASRPSPDDGALHEDTWVTLSWAPGDSAVTHDVYLGEDFDDVNDATTESEVFQGNQESTFFVAGFPGYAFPDGLVPGKTYYWRIDEVNDADPNSPWKGLVWSFSVPPRTAYNPDPADGAEAVGPDDVTLSWTPGFGAKLHTVYFGETFDDVNDATGGASVGITTHDPGPLEPAKVYYWRVDEFDAAATYKGDVWSFTTPGAVGNPQPAYKATDVAMNALLSWTEADSAVTHHLYFGTDKEAVRNADTSAPEYKGSILRADESYDYDPGLLEADTAYYWRVDAVDAQSNVSTGPLWVFTTGAFLLVDDFESYTDDDAAGKAIWQTWIDGYGVADNGAQVGELVPPYCEQTIIHGGSQSMPLYYVNEAPVTNSEATKTLTALRDWTLAGVTDLSLWFRGSSGNATEPLYVAVSSAVVAHDDAGAAENQSWTEWRIPLQAFADQGVNLGNVDQIAIGLGSKGGAAAGGSGKMYIDDIRLCQP